MYTILPCKKAYMIPTNVFQEPGIHIIYLYNLKAGCSSVTGPICAHFLGHPRPIDPGFKLNWAFQKRMNGRLESQNNPSQRCGVHI